MYVRTVSIDRMMLIIRDRNTSKKWAHVHYYAKIFISLRYREEEKTVFITRKANSWINSLTQGLVSDEQ